MGLYLFTAERLADRSVHFYIIIYNIKENIMEDIKVSVIMPVYNAEKYLRKCLDSVITQTLREIEIICVDDGSTDDSKTILEEFAKADSRGSGSFIRRISTPAARGT